MEPIPLPDEVRALANERGFLATVIGPPDGMSILDDHAPKPVEALVARTNEGTHFNILVHIDEHDKELLESNGGRFWLTINARQLPPFSITVFVPDKDGGDMNGGEDTRFDPRQGH